MAQVLQRPTDAGDGTNLRELHGRQFNTMNNMYQLPADTPEHVRLGLQHEALLLAVGGLYQARADVQAALAVREGKPKPAILDIGTGSGIWAISMAREFPDCDVVGVDLAPVGVVNTSDVPPNCRFECRDANQGFSESHNSYDVVHARCMGTGIKDRDAFFHEVKKILRPGGVFLFVDGDLHVYSEAYEQLPWCEPGEPGFSWVQKAFSATYKALEAKGLPIGRQPRDAYNRLEKIAEFENIGAMTVFVPIGGWPSNSDSRMGELMGKDATQIIQGMRPLLLAGGQSSPAAVDEVVRNAEVEIQSLRLRTYSAWHYSWARKADTIN